MFFAVIRPVSFRHSTPSTRSTASSFTEPLMSDFSTLISSAAKSFDACAALIGHVAPTFCFPATPNSSSSVPRLSSSDNWNSSSSASDAGSGSSPSFSENFVSCPAASATITFPGASSSLSSAPETRVHFSTVISSFVARPFGVAASTCTVPTSLMPIPSAGCSLRSPLRTSTFWRIRAPSDSTLNRSPTLSGRVSTTSYDASSARAGAGRAAAPQRSVARVRRACRGRIGRLLGRVCGGGGGAVTACAARAARARSGRAPAAGTGRRQVGRT